MEAFFKSSEAIPESVPEAVTAPPKGKKRKIQEDKKDDQEELKQKARLFCQCSEQWKIISKYNVEKLKGWVEEKEFDQQRALFQTVFDFTQRAIAFGFDLICKGDTYVDQEIQNDVSLRQAIEVEAANWVQFLSNRFKIATLIAIDVSNGKIKQRLENKASTVTIVEEKENGRSVIDEFWGGKAEEEDASGAVSGGLSASVDCNTEC